MHLSYWLIFYRLSAGSCGKRKLDLEAGDERPPDWQQHWARGREVVNSRWHLPPDGCQSPKLIRITYELCISCLQVTDVKVNPLDTTATRVAFCVGGGKDKKVSLAALYQNLLVASVPTLAVLRGVEAWVANRANLLPNLFRFRHLLLWEFFGVLWFWLLSASNQPPTGVVPCPPGSLPHHAQPPATGVEPRHPCGPGTGLWADVDARRQALRSRRT